MKMVYIKMKKSSSGCNDGHTVQWYEEGKVYPVGTILADIFIKMNVANIEEFCWEV